MCKARDASLTHLLIQSLVVLKQRLEGLEDFHLTGDPRRGLGLSFHHRHPQTALMAGYQTLQVFQQQLQEPMGWKETGRRQENVLKDGDTYDEERKESKRQKQRGQGKRSQKDKEGPETMQRSKRF